MKRFLTTIAAVTAISIAACAQAEDEPEIDTLDETVPPAAAPAPAPAPAPMDTLSPDTAASDTLR